MAEGKFIAYYRVSTDKQGESGLGLEAQKNAVHEYLNGGNWELVAEYVEVESGKRVKNRPKLQEALTRCKKQKAVLIIAKLDRLARNVAFIAGLMDSGVKFVCAEMPNANDFMLHIYSAVAQEERRLISQRTKQALQSAKMRGTILGKHGKEVLAPLNKKTADEFALSMIPMIDELRSEAIYSIRKTQQALNERNVPSFRGGSWSKGSVENLLKRIKTF